MRVLIAPGPYAGSLGAVAAATAIATGWSRQAPGDDLAIVPVSDGGPGLLDVVQHHLAGALHALTVPGPLGTPVPAAVLVTGDGPERAAYVEAEQVCGTALLPRAGGAVEPGVAERASSAGVGHLVAAAVDAGARRVVVGLGDTGSHDGGAGLLAALGAVAGPPDSLERGALGLAELEAVDLDPARRRLAGSEIVVATQAGSDAAAPLLGLRGTTNVSGRRRGLAEDRIMAVDGALTRLAHAAGRDAADVPGAGAGGGLGYALLLLGGRVRPAVDLVAELVGLDAAVHGCDLVVTGEGDLESAALRGTVLASVVQRANAAGRPCIVLAEHVGVGSRELRAGGVEAAYGADLLAAGVADPADALADLAERVARTWSR